MSPVLKMCLYCLSDDQLWPLRIKFLSKVGKMMAQ